MHETVLIYLSQLNNFFEDIIRYVSDYRLTDYLSVNQFSFDLFSKLLDVTFV